MSWDGVSSEQDIGTAGFFPPETENLKNKAENSALFLSIKQEDKPLNDWLQRTRLLLGEQAVEKLKNAKVALLGLGGVGGACAEALCRAGIGSLMLVDNDKVEITNLNRQTAATRETIGQEKCRVMGARLKAINPEISLVLEKRFYLPQESDFLYGWEPDYVVDAIDTVTAKLHLAQQCYERGIPLIMCLGTGNRLDPGKLRQGKMEDTVGCGCPLARVMRRELKKRGVAGQNVVYSTEEPKNVISAAKDGRHSPASISFVPPVAGYLMAAAVVGELTGYKHGK